MKKMLVVLMCVALFMCCSYAFAGESWVCPRCGAENSENFCVKCFGRCVLRKMRDKDFAG